MALASGPSALLFAEQIRTLARRSPKQCAQHSIRMYKVTKSASQHRAGSSARLATELVLIATCSWALTPLHAAEVTLEQVVARHIEAVGGREAVERVRSVQYAITIVEPKFTVDGIYRADRKLRMRIDVVADGKRVFTEAYDGREAWEMGGDGVVHPSNEKGTAALRNGILFPGKLFGLHETHLTGSKLRLLGRETLDRASYHVVELTLPGGDVTQLYVNPDNWLIERSRVKKALHPDADPTEKLFETHFSDFRKVDGVLRPFKSVEVEVESGAVVQTTSVKEVVTNPVLDDALFRKT